MEEDSEFRDLIIKKLENNGVLLKMKAALRAQIYLLDKENASDDSQASSITNNDSSIEPIDNTLNVAFSLVHDLLDCLKLDVTKSIFKAESGEHAKYTFQTRTDLIETLQLNDGSGDESDQMLSPNDSKVPILVKYLMKNGLVSKLDDVNDTFAVAASTSNSTE
ncbi:hypothetical protein HA402_014229 [Bradysia odoriphaga]|nr:hypothetical protein HA402_014229 [Bradysia odoriphaga]